MYTIYGDRQPPYKGKGGAPIICFSTFLTFKVTAISKIVIETIGLSQCLPYLAFPPCHDMPMMTAMSSTTRAFPKGSLHYVVCESWTWRETNWSILLLRSVSAGDGTEISEC